MSDSDLDPLIDAMQRLTIGPPGRSVKPGPLHLPGSSPSSHRWQSLKEKERIRRRSRRNIPPHAMRAMALAHATDIVQCAAVATQGNSMGLWCVHLLRHGVRPRHSPPQDNVEPM